MMSKLPVLLLASLVFGCDSGSENGNSNYNDDSTRNYIFISSSTSSGNLGGLDGADATCQSLANASTLPQGVYKAWLSSSTIAAKDRLAQSDSPYYLPNGALFANNWSDIVTHNFAFTLGSGSGIDVDENGNKIANPQYIWTNTTEDGSISNTAASSHCVDWSSAAGTGAIGKNDQDTNEDWTAERNLTCAATTLRLYCIQQDSLSNITAEPQGANCTWGGSKIERGIDNGDSGGIANNGTLEAGEVDTTQYDCDAVGAGKYQLGAITLTLDMAKIVCENDGRILANWSNKMELNAIIQLCQGQSNDCYTQYKVNDTTDGHDSVIDGSSMPSYYSYTQGMSYTLNRYVMARYDLFFLFEQQNVGLPICMEKPYTLGGAGPSGGVVVQVDSDGLHGLEAVNTSLMSAKFGCLGTSIAGAQNTGIGSGAANTLAIVNNCAEANIAAKVANDFEYNGFSDWYLPTKDELNLIRLQRDQLKIDGQFMTSTESSVINFWQQDMSDGTQFSTSDKDSSSRIAVMRTF